MRREQFSLAVTDADWVDTGDEPRLPTLTVTYDGRSASLGDRLEAGLGAPPSAGDADVTVRLQRRADDGEAEAVVGLAHRLTGDYVLEASTSPEVVLGFSRAARRYGETADDGPRFRVRVVAEDEALASFEKDTLLVYGPDGELLRQHSLIPSGVEL